MGFIYRLICFVAITHLVTAVSDCNGNTSPGHKPTTIPPHPDTSTIPMTTTVEQDTTITQQETSNPPLSTSAPPTQTTEKVTNTTSAQCENDTSLPEFDDEVPPASNTTTSGDEKCTCILGNCTTAEVCEGGQFVTGLCAGPKNRKCCIKDDPKPKKFVLVTREEWGSTVKREDLAFMKLPVSKVIISHTAGQEGCTAERCKELVRNIQAGHKKRKDENGNFWIDIAYNFLICGDGKVYEGRGWNRIGAHTRGSNANSIGIAFIGNFENKLPPIAALMAGRFLSEYGVANGKLIQNKQLLGQREVVATKSPGDALFNFIKKLRKRIAGN